MLAPDNFRGIWCWDFVLVRLYKRSRPLIRHHTLITVHIAFRGFAFGDSIGLRCLWNVSAKWGNTYICVHKLSLFVLYTYKTKSDNLSDHTKQIYLKRDQSKWDPMNFRLRKLKWNNKVGLWLPWNINGLSVLGSFLNSVLRIRVMRTVTVPKMCILKV